MDKFEVGDKVIGIKTVDGVNLTGCTGVVMGVDHENDYPYGVAFDEEFEDLHSLDGLCEDGHGWWCFEDALELVEDEEISRPVKHKYSIGDRVLVKYSKDSRSVVNMTGVICAYNVSDDTYDYGVHFDESKDVFHSCGDACPPYYGWWVREEEIELMVTRTPERLEDMWL